MMPEFTAISLIQTLSPDHQKQVIEFIAYLKAREQVESTTHSEMTWESDPFFGIWSDRIDMQDSTEWVRQLRQDQWSRS